MQPGSSVSFVARRYGLSPSLLFRWKRRMIEGGHEAVGGRQGASADRFQCRE
jgi:transposase